MDLATLNIKIETKDIKEAEQALKKLLGESAQVETQFEKTSKATSTLSDSFGKLVVAFSAYLGFAAIKDFAADSAKAFMDQENAINKMVVALKNQGQYSQAAVKDFEDYASAVQKVTTAADELVMSIMANLKSYGMSNDEVKRATQAALDLAAAKKEEGMSITTAGELIGKAYAGQTQTLARYGIVLDETLTAGQKFEAVLALISQRFGGAAQAELDTYAGRWKNLANEWGDVKEIVGKLVLELGENLMPILRELIPVAAQVATAMTNMFGQNDSAADIAIKAHTENIEALQEQIRGLENSLNIWLSGIDTVDNFIKNIFGIGDDTEAQIADLNRAIETNIESINKLKGEINGLSEAMNVMPLDKLFLYLNQIASATVPDEIKKAKEEFKEFSEISKENAAEAKKAQAEFEKLNKEISKLQEEAQKSLEAMTPLEKFMANDMPAALEKMRRGVIELSTGLTDAQLHDREFLMNFLYGPDVETKLAQSEIEVQEYLDSVSDKTKNANDAMSKSWENLWTNIQSLNAETIRGMLDGNLDSWEDYGDAILDIMKDTLAQIISMFLQNQIIIPIVTSLTGGGPISGAASSVGGGFLSSVLEGGISYIKDGISSIASFLGIGGTGGGVGGSLSGIISSVAPVAGVAGMVAIAAKVFSEIYKSWFGSDNSKTWLLYAPEVPVSIGSDLQADYDLAAAEKAIAQERAAKEAAYQKALADWQSVIDSGIQSSQPRPNRQDFFPEEVSAGYEDAYGNTVYYDPKDAWLTHRDKLEKTFSEYGQKIVDSYIDYLNNVLPEDMVEGVIDSFKGTKLTIPEFEKYFKGDKDAAGLDELLKQYGQAMAEQIFAELQKKAMASIKVQLLEDLGETGMFDTLTKVSEKLSTFEEAGNIEGMLQFVDGIYAFIDSLSVFGDAIATEKAAIDRAAEETVDSLISQVNALLQVGQEYGISVDAMSDATKRLVVAVLEGTDSLTPWERAIYEASANFEEMERALMYVGYTAEEAAEMAGDAFHEFMLNFERDFKEWQMAMGGMTEFDIILDRYGWTVEEAAKLLEWATDAQNTSTEEFSELAQALKNIDPSMTEDKLKQVFQTIARGLNDIDGAVSSLTQTAEEVARAAIDAANAANKISSGSTPSYQLGGSFSGGIRLVGESGPELEFTGPSTIYSNNDTMNMLVKAAEMGVGEYLSNSKFSFNIPKVAGSSYGVGTSQSLNQLTRSAEDLESAFSSLESALETIKEMIEDMEYGELAPVSSYEKMQYKYDYLIDAIKTATSEEDKAKYVQELNQFLPEYLDFMNAFGLNYQQLHASVLADLKDIEATFQTELDYLSGILENTKRMSQYLQNISSGGSSGGSSYNTGSAGGSVTIGTWGTTESTRTSICGGSAKTFAMLDEMWRENESGSSSGQQIATINSSTSISGNAKVTTSSSYASGGLFGGGLRLVGEMGPELEFTGPSRIYDANRSREMLSSAFSDAMRGELSNILGLAMNNDFINSVAERMISAKNAGNYWRSPDALGGPQGMLGYTSNYSESQSVAEIGNTIAAAIQSSMSNAKGDMTIVVKIGDRELKDIVVETMPRAIKTDPNVQHEMRRVMQ